MDSGLFRRSLTSSIGNINIYDGENDSALEPRYNVDVESFPLKTIETTGNEISESKGVLEPKQHVDKKLPGRKYKYSVPIDPNDGDRATSFRLIAFARPHMRAFWATNIAHRATIFMWFSAVPLYPEIMASLGLTKEETWTSSMWAIGGALVSRLVMGFVCERYGARIPLAVLTVFAAIPTALQGVVQTAYQFYAARFFVGIGAGSFVASNFWINSMFKKELAASISGLSNGLGMAIGACQVFLTCIVFPSIAYFSGSEEIAWRASFAAISFGSLCVGVPLAFLTDDTPKGNYAKLKRTGDINPLSHWKNFYYSIRHLSVWILSIQHALNLGIELVVNNVLMFYAMEEFGLSIEMAGFFAATFPIFSQMGRANGGRFTDRTYKENGIKGILRYHLFYLFFSGILFLVYSSLTNLWASLVVLCMLALFIFFSQSATFGIVPHICPDSNGVVSGIVSAAGTLGGIILAFLFRDLSYRDAFHSTGILFILSSFLTVFLIIPGHGNIFLNEERQFNQKTLEQDSDFTDCSDDSTCSTSTLSVWALLPG